MEDIICRVLEDCGEARVSCNLVVYEKQGIQLQREANEPAITNPYNSIHRKRYVILSVQ